MSTQYLTPIPQESYQKTGVLSSIIGFIILAYFFMYSSPHQVTKAPTKPKTDLWYSKFSWQQLLRDSSELASSSAVSA